MKVVCINNCWHPGRGSVWSELTIGKSYDVLSFIYEEPNGRKVEIPSIGVFIGTLAFISIICLLIYALV